MDMQELRAKIDRVDDEIVRLYGERMELAREIGRYKQAKGLPVQDEDREKALLDRVAAKAGKENADGVRVLFSLLMARSRAVQEAEVREDSPGETLK